jgi:hypothetical protein
MGTEKRNLENLINPEKILYLEYDYDSKEVTCLFDNEIKYKYILKNSKFEKLLEKLEKYYYRNEK